MVEVSAHDEEAIQCFREMVQTQVSNALMERYSSESVPRRRNQARLEFEDGGRVVVTVTYRPPEG